jgi:hypothetical protein
MPLPMGNYTLCPRFDYPWASPVRYMGDGTDVQNFPPNYYQSNQIWLYQGQLLAAATCQPVGSYSMPGVETRYYNSQLFPGAFALAQL